MQYAVEQLSANLAVESILTTVLISPGCERNLGWISVHTDNLSETRVDWRQEQ